MGFTDISASLPAEKVSDFLDRFYTKLGALAQRFGLFQARTLRFSVHCGTQDRIQKDPEIAIRSCLWSANSLHEPVREPSDPYQVETIGDAFIAAAGIPDYQVMPAPDHATSAS